ncbi:MAG: CapA family protein [Clostridia bacterium]|nr:CapA family protein [Clostridia bacterium]
MKRPSINLMFLILILIVILIFVSIFISQLLKINSKDLKINYDNNVSNTIETQNESSILENSLSSENSEVRPKIIAKAVVPEDISLTISAIGDIMCHNTQFKDAYSNGTYDFSYVFSDIEPFIKDADISIGNLETTFAGNQKKYQGYPNFNTPEALAFDLSELGIDVITTSNNHSLDTGYSGLESTLNFLDEANISHVGTARSVEEQNSILIKEVKGLKIAFLSYTYGTNGIPIPSEKEYCINLIDKDFILSQLENAKSQNPDLICVSMHWGNEYELVQNESQIDLTNFLFENGTDIIFGGHPHVLQPLECRTIELPDGSTKNGFVIYSLGNFMSGQTKENTRTSIILTLKLTKHGDTGKFTIDEVLYTPIYTYTSPNYKNYKVLDIQKAIYNYENNLETPINQTYYTLFKKELEKVNSIYIP